MEYPKRKLNRIPEFDYGGCGAYFITVCTKDRRNLFHNVGAVIDRPLGESSYTEYGKIVDAVIRKIPERYPAVTIDKYVVMPNHVHILLRINADNIGRPMVAPTVSTIVQQMKGRASKDAGIPLWQKGFHDHVVRGNEDYLEIWQYIDNNPAKCCDDEHYPG